MQRPPRAHYLYFGILRQDHWRCQKQLGLLHGAARPPVLAIQAQEDEG